MFIAQVAQVESLMALAERVKNDIELQNNLQLDSISVSQLSRRLKEMSSDFWELFLPRWTKLQWRQGGQVP